MPPCCLKDRVCTYYLHSSKYSAVRTRSEFLYWGYTEKHCCCTVPQGSPGCLVWLEVRQHLVLAKEILSLKDTEIARERRHHATTQHSYNSTVEKYLSSKLLQKNQNCSVKYFGLLIREENKQTPKLLQLQQSMKYNFKKKKKEKTLSSFNPQALNTLFTWFPRQNLNPPAFQQFPKLISYTILAKSVQTIEKQKVSGVN